VEILEGLQQLAELRPIIFPAHPRTQKQIERFGFSRYFHFAGEAQTQAPAGTITLLEAQGYLDFLCLMKNASLVVTDSGGIQEETTCLGVPCITVRENTERPVTIESGTNVLAGVGRAGIRSAIQQQLRSRPRQKAPPLWDGKASGRIVEVLARCGRGSAPLLAATLQD
jgi:UDP-N-acetylglucosamine 2-epimerase (non-hydrolysing)